MDTCRKLSGGDLLTGLGGHILLAWTPAEHTENAMDQTMGIPAKPKQNNHRDSGVDQTMEGHQLTKPKQNNTQRKHVQDGDLLTGLDTSC